MGTVNKDLSNYNKATIPNAKNFRFGIVVSEWNGEITERLYKGIYSTLIDCGVLDANIIRWNVPGSFELIYGSKKMQKYFVDVVIAVGCVIQGETKHFDFVCNGVTQGVKDLNVIHETPVIFCVLTDTNIEQSLARSGGKYGNKGTESAIAAIKMAALRRIS